jgi:glycosyltransferase involved in cell wall biosynthesis
MLSLTLLICTHNRAALLRRLLESLAKTRRPPALELQTLVVANACTDDTLSTLAHSRMLFAQDSLELQVVEEPTPGKSNALNRGIRDVRSEWIAFVDDDHRFPEDYLEQVCRALLAQRHADMVCGRILPDWDGSEPAWVHDQGPYRIFPLPIPRQDFGAEERLLRQGDPIPGGGNLIVKTRLVQELDGFARDLGPRGHDLGGGEDSDFVLRALHSGFTLWYAPHIVQWHYVDPDRLKVGYLARKAYARSAAAERLAVRGNNRPTLPLYLVRKFASYLIGVILALQPDRRRFYVVRAAAALGEVAAHIRPRRNATA